MTPLSSRHPGELFMEARIVLYSNTRLLSTMRHTIGNLTVEMGWNDSELRAITLAVDEALTNKIRHAYKNNPHGRILFEFWTEPGALLFKLTDQGEPPDPEKICARRKESLTPGGFGTHIIRDVMDKVVYQTVAEGNQLLLTKYLPNITRTPEDSQ